MARTAEQRFWSKVDKTTECWNWTASKDGTGYGKFWSIDRLTPAHRYSFTLAHGTIPEGQLIDHICHNKACVNPAHLRLADAKQNQQHRRGAQTNNTTSGMRGVTWHKGDKRWQAQLAHQGKYIYCGQYLTVGEAEDAVRAKRRELFTHSDMDNVA